MYLFDMKVNFCAIQIILCSLSFDVYAVKFGMVDDNAPWSYMLEGEPKGISYKFCKTLSSEISVACEPILYKSYPRMISDLNRGFIGMAASHRLDGRNPSESQWLYCSQGFYSKSNFGVYALSNSGIKITSSDDFKNYSIAMVRIMDELHISFPYKVLSKHATPDLMYKFLISGRADMVIMTKRNIDAWRKLSGREFVLLHDMGVLEANVCLSKLYFSKPDFEFVKNKLEEILSGD